MLVHSRIDRLNSLFKQELSNLLLFEIKDPRIGFVTVTRVSVTKDLSIAKVFVSVYGSREEQEKTFVGLNSAKGFIKRKLGRVIKIRRIPDLVFKMDNSLEEGFRMNQIIEGLNISEYS